MTDRPAPAWRTFDVALGRLREPPGPNPNVMTPEALTALAANMRWEGCLQPILVRVLPGHVPPPPHYADPRHPTEEELIAESAWLLSDDPLEVIDGSHRREAAELAGLSYVPVTAVVASDAVAAALRVGMNKIRGELDLGEVGRILSALADAGADDEVQLTGYSPEEVADLLAAVHPADAEVDAMAALGGPGETPPPAVQTYPMELRFTQRRDRDRVKEELKVLGEGSPEIGLLALLDRSGETE